MSMSPVSYILSVKCQRGSVLIFTFVTMLTLTAIAAAFLYMISIRTKSSGLNLANGQAFWLAEAGRAKARWALTADEKNPGWGTSDIALGQGAYSVTSRYDGSTDMCIIISDGYIPSASNPVARSRVVESNITFSSVITNLSLRLGRGKFSTF